MNISECRQTCRLKVKIRGEKPKDVMLLMAHQYPEGLNSCPVGEHVHFTGEGWHESKDVEVIEVLPW